MVRADERGYSAGYSACYSAGYGYTLPRTRHLKWLRNPHQCREGRSNRNLRWLRLRRRHLREHTWLGLKWSESFASPSWSRIARVWTHSCRLAGHSSRCIGHRKHVDESPATACGCNCLCTKPTFMRPESCKTWFLNPKLSPPSGCHPPTFCDRPSEDNKAQDMRAKKSHFTAVASTCTLISANTNSGCQRQTYPWGKMDGLSFHYSH